MSDSRPRVLWIEPALEDDLPPAVKNALVARRQANRAGRCPTCKAPLEVRGADASGVLHAFMEHEAWCAVGDPLGAV